jgi:hypothetical protein
LQPQYRFFFKPFKHAFIQICGTWIIYHPGRGITELTFGKLCAEAWGRAAIVSTGVNEFKACLIYSLNRHVIEEAAMALSKMFPREAPQSTSISEASDKYNVSSPSTTVQNAECAKVSTSNRKHTEREASPTATSSSALSSAVTFEDV